MSSNGIVKYCPCCGDIEYNGEINDNKCCKFCGTTLKNTSFTFKDIIGNEENDKKLEEMIISSPEYNENLREKRHSQSTLFGGSKTSATSSVHCPYCKSTNVSRLSTVGKVFSVGLLGLASNKVGKQWHCNNCNSNCSCRV